MSISKNIIRLREKYQLTQAQLGEIAGVTDRAVSAWEKGVAEPRMGAIQKIADHFRLKKSELVDDNDNPLTPTPLSTDEVFMLDKYRSFNDEGKGKLIAYADDLNKAGIYKQ